MSSARWVLLAGCRLVTAAWAVGLSGGLPGLAEAQDRGQTPSTTIEWVLSPVETGWCLHFLIAPDWAGRDLPRDLSPAAASGVSGLHPAILRLVAADPQFGQWTPAELCTVIAGGLQAGDRRFEQGDGGEPLILVWWSVSAIGPDGATTANRYLGANSTGLKQLVKSSLLDLDRVKARQESVPDSPDQRLRIDLEGATLFFESHVTPDTVATARVHHWEWVATGPRNVPWKGEGEAAPDSAGGVAGALRIQGKRGLAAILAESPIRIFGSGFTGGSFSLHLTR